jgi:hypothetical protein
MSRRYPLVAQIVELRSPSLTKDWNARIATASNPDLRACRLIEGQPCNCRNVCFRSDGGCPCTREPAETHPIIIVDRER